MNSVADSADSVNAVRQLPEEFRWLAKLLLQLWFLHSGSAHCDGSAHCEGSAHRGDARWLQAVLAVAIGLQLLEVSHPPMTLSGQRRPG